jgi:hypothetical protein
MVRAILIIACLLSFSACTKLSTPQPVTIREKISVVGIDTFEIEIIAGRVIILNGNGSEIEVVGSSSQPKQIVIAQKDGILKLSSLSKDEADLLTIYLPIGFSFEFYTFKASVEVQGVFDTASIRSTAGEVWMQDFDGKGVIWAGRGTVRVEEGEGSIAVISEHGDQFVDDFKGKVLMTSIMGNLEYSGWMDDDNDVELEVDHGFVRVDLPSSAGLQIIVTSTSGYVTCVGKGLVQTISGCEGGVGSGTGKLRVRTVSGNVDLWVMDLVESKDE